MQGSCGKTGCSPFWGEIGISKVKDEDEVPCKGLERARERER